MSLLLVEGLCLSYGSKALFEDDSFVVGPRDRIGLVGANGTGKSSLLKVLAGKLLPDSGSIRFSRRSRAGYLPQEIAALSEGPLLEAVLSAVPGHDQLEARVASTQAALAQSASEDEQLELAQELADLHGELEHFDERHGRHHAERILTGLGFHPAELGRPTASLSGGWRMRAALAGLLLQDPDLLLLDEPTNHLDLPTLAWFDQFLANSQKAMLLVSHDRDFLNRHIDRVLSLEVEGLRSYAGTYEDYRRQRAEELEQLTARAERQAAHRAEVEAFIERFRAKASKARQVQSRLKALEREQAVELRGERKRVGFSFPAVARSGREVLSLQGVRKAYGTRVVYEELNATLLRGQRVAVVGPNGAGKSTLLKLLARELEPDQGVVTHGHNVALGYYAQHHSEGLDARATVLEEACQAAPEKPTSHVRGVLGSFLFSGDEVDKPVAVLSGGEKARVALAKLLLRPANLLLMDEPTNHLDLDSSEALIESLSRYDGTLLFVSHNRSFLDRLATEVWDVKDRQVVPFPGSLGDYLYHLQKLVRPEDPATSGERSRQSERERRRAEAEERQRRNALDRPIKQEIAQLEARIEQLEAEQKEREAELLAPSLYTDFARAKPVMDAYQQGKLELEALYSSWESAQSRLGALAPKEA